MHWYNRFEDTYNPWFNTYKVDRIVGMHFLLGTNDRPMFMRLEEAPNPASQNAVFLLKYRGVQPSYCGEILSDGNWYCYVVDGHPVQHLLEPQLNLFCRTQIRQAIREYVDAMEMWPIKEQ